MLVDLKCDVLGTWPGITLVEPKISARLFVESGTWRVTRRRYTVFPNHLVADRFERCSVKLLVLFNIADDDSDMRDRGAIFLGTS
jgi:hypothetical protein